MAVEFGSSIPPAPPIPVGGAAPVLPPLPPPPPAAPALDSYAPAAAAYPALPPVGNAMYAQDAQQPQLGSDLARLGSDGATVLGEVGQSALNGTSQVAGVVARNAPAVGQAVLNGTSQVAGVVARNAPAVGQAVLNGTSQVAGVVARNAPAVGQAAWNGAQAVGNTVYQAAPAVGHGLLSGLGFFGRALSSIFHGLGSLFGIQPRTWDGPVIVAQPGDTLATIAKRTLGDPRRWLEIWNWNRDLLPDPNGVQPGMLLRLPPYVDGGPVTAPPDWSQAGLPPIAIPVAAPGQAPAPVAAAPTPVSASPTPAAAPAPKASSVPAGTRYTVKSGDTLWALAQRYYGDGNAWGKIYDANRDQIANPHWIYPGQTLTIPRG